MRNNKKVDMPAFKGSALRGDEKSPSLGKYRLPYYPLYRMKINREWILCLDCDLEGDVEIGMMFFAGVLGSKLKLPPDMLEKINEVLKEAA